MNTKKPFAPKDPAKYDHAKRLYLDKVPLREIAERLGITPQTLTKWKKEGAWQASRNASLLSPKTIYNKLLKQLDDLIERGDPLATADAISKICKQIKSLQKEATADDVILALTGFGDWLVAEGKRLKTSREFVQELTRLQDIYIHYLLERDNLLTQQADD
ncbi:helix-turn-helix domain-containing protein [uncultured Porphyromonas sp.]|uniref:helix-turn-helix domain-containing protein n=1 Tax=uncultured Porphyromonas sp. TaxID=159274 RepID=UPI002612C1FF|nr:helix-turn-helix domain-containing protein [uncultured Porphyromonas sp.]